MTSQDQFEAWAAEHLPTLYLTKTEQGTYESTATGNFFAVWSARDGEIERLRAIANLRDLLPDLDEALEDLEVHGQHSDQGYRKLKDWYRKVAQACKAIDAANGGVEPDLISQNEWLRRQIESIAGQHAPLQPIPDEDGWSRKLPGYDLVSLLRDSERYRWFRSQHWDSSAICAVVDPKQSTKLGAYCPSGKLLDDAVDAGLAMSKGEQP